MPRFFYDIDDRGRRVVDQIGMVKADAVDALLEVPPILEQLAANGGCEARAGIMSVTVRNHRGESVHMTLAVYAPRTC